MNAPALSALIILAAIVGVILAYIWDEWELPWWEDRTFADILRDLLKQAAEDD